MANMPKPQVAIANVDMPNAFATGRDQKHAVVCVTTGILRRLDEPELEAVLAHELSHVAHRDVAVMTIASFLGILAGLLTRVLLYAGLFGGFGGGNSSNQGGGNSGGQVALIELGMLAFSAVIYAISFLLIRTLSRYRELAADRSGAILIGQPRAARAGAREGDAGDVADPDPRPPCRRSTSTPSSSPPRSRKGSASPPSSRPTPRSSGASSS